MEAAARAFDGGAARTRAPYLFRQADTQWRKGHREEACGTAHQALRACLPADGGWRQVIEWPCYGACPLGAYVGIARMT